MAVAQTINHIAAIFVPALGGWLWVEFSCKSRSSSVRRSVARRSCSCRSSTEK
ncbi:MAG: hypothetical protein ACLSHC_05600 [Bilophila wadsworthia]